ncbi:hypothetical protein N7499_010484 [Penicillium canescens]|uniref:Mid2 domain-containing protein n=1 Tax=Penicillium canescens TaxID=5083 RepID=A0AAD6NBV8_PENCN|nr:uncharacterized protein N7446_005751 [Penicillium canescens]KAJ5989958.1 hypothetical protein N7522_010165 [Penicillium canescens]KAJ6051119.1 hypothetical protein N7460_001653 [Penicillium canescens]KAJ6061631.1 hypothetical protein N7446_005751 [Penicillium canescens]KAJ6064878.1 hypothetical protein N7444_000531 [Penicillium canescens]KAJ6068597.1 hypothetical protein N7499_010484 [Penicillium canescens]
MSSTNYADYSTGTGFIGWYIAATPQPIACTSNGAWTTSGTIGDCSESSGDRIATACYAGSSVVRGSTTEACGTGSTCDYYRIFNTVGQDGLGALTRYACVNNWAANSLYRTLPAEYLATTTSTSVTSATTTATTKTTNSSFSTSASTSTTSSPTSTGGTGSSDSSSSGLGSGAIAGIVVGCVAGGAILALLIVFRRRIVGYFGHHKTTDSHEPWSPVYMPPQTQSVFQSNSQFQPISELSGQPNIHEIGSSQVGADAVPEMRS